MSPPSSLSSKRSVSKSHVDVRATTQKRRSGKRVSSSNPFAAFAHLFFEEKGKDRVHRLNGLLYIVQFILAVLQEASPAVKRAVPVDFTFTLPLTGWLQAVIAVFTFKLPKTQGKVQGYYSDKRTMTMDFVLENVYFSGLLLFQAAYFKYGHKFRAIPPLEIILVFFPYYVIRPFFPKTSFRASMKNDKEKSKENRDFMNTNLKFIKPFYVLAKHVQGYGLNYLLYANAVPAEHSRTIRVLLLLGGWGTTIAMFLHTLKFKGYLSPRASMLLYTGSFPLFIFGYFWMGGLAIQNPAIALVVLLGVPINFLHVRVQQAYQIAAFLAVRHIANA